MKAPIHTPPARLALGVDPRTQQTAAGKLANRRSQARAVGSEGRLAALLLVLVGLAGLLFALSATVASAAEPCPNEAVRAATALDCAARLPRLRDGLSRRQERRRCDGPDPLKTRASSIGRCGRASLPCRPSATRWGRGSRLTTSADAPARPARRGGALTQSFLQQDAQSLDFSGIGGGQSPIYVGEFSEDLSKGVFRSLTPLTDAPNVATTRNLYVRDDLRQRRGGQLPAVDRFADAGRTAVRLCVTELLQRGWVPAGACRRLERLQRTSCSSRR